MKKGTRLFLVLCLLMGLSVGPVWATSTAIETTNTEAISTQSQETQKMYHGKKIHRKDWADKSVGQIVLHKGIFVAGTLIFLFLGTIVVRKGWETGGCCCSKKKKK